MGEAFINVDSDTATAFIEQQREVRTDWLDRLTIGASSTYRTSPAADTRDPA